MKVVSIVGNRPQFIKAAPVAAALDGLCDHVLVHTGQHYDDELSQVFFEELGLPAARPPASRAASGTHAEQTARMLVGARAGARARRRPTPSSSTATRTPRWRAPWSRPSSTCRSAHVEAGLRSFDRRMPEELNRWWSTHSPTCCFCPSDTAVSNLARRGDHGRRPPGGRRDGRRGADVRAGRARRSDALTEVGVEPGGYVILTAHRPANVDCPRRLGALVEVIEAVEMPIVFPVHPRTRAALERAGLLERAGAAACTSPPPLGYLDFTALLMSARAPCLTDSGGVQKEAYLHSACRASPCATRPNGSRPSTPAGTGWSISIRRPSPAALASATPPGGASAALRRRQSGRPHRRCHHRRSIASAPHANGRRYRRRGLRGPAAGRRIRPRRALGGVRRGRRAPGRGDRPRRELHRGRRLGRARGARERGDGGGHRRVRRAGRGRRDPDLPPDAALDATASPTWPC